ncbi:hypothetical protein SADUNF_Sadunf19G0052400 [Salix dunnii]|uniref:Uncharacterized protein n=1 Tax=Salix dunnii TaxID=1413687 RepID=A0A835J184_9ROSI|nr:hypothetical protein SADUNF_Sadunf19G0052400 [Salix dunnii]
MRERERERERESSLNRTCFCLFAAQTTPTRTATPAGQCLSINQRILIFRLCVYSWSRCFVNPSVEESDAEMEWDEMMNNRSEENSRRGNVSWILNKGLLVGKMILIGGFLISLAPVILPSFVVVSAIWFACSVPYGLFLASYDFTDQLMSKILPASSHHSLEYYGTNKNIFVDDYREDDARVDQFGGDIIDMEKEGEPELFLKDKNNASLVEENGYEEGVEDHKPPSKTQQAEEEDEEQVIERVSAILMEKEPIQNVRSDLSEKKDFGDNTKGGPQGDFACVKQNLQLIRDKELVVSPPNEDAREIADESGLDLFDDRQAVGPQCSYTDYRNPEAREIADESGLDLFDDRQAVGPQCSYTDYRNPEGSEQSSYKAYEVTRPTTVDDSKCTGITPENDIQLAAGDAKVLYSEDKIWKQIRAIRTIVGYKASVRGTCIEELKALYVFTGVEPPASFMDPSDLAEVDEKVKFLMTIVGVK